MTPFNLEGIDFGDMDRDEILSALMDAAYDGAYDAGEEADFAGVEDQPRDENGRWTGGEIHHENANKVQDLLDNINSGKVTSAHIDELIDHLKSTMTKEQWDKFLPLVRVRGKQSSIKKGADTLRTALRSQLEMHVKSQFSADFYSDDQPRDNRGRWTSGAGDDAAREYSSRAVRDFAKGHSEPSRGDVAKVADHLARMTVKQLHSLKAEHGIKASAPDKAALVAKLSERFGAHRAANLAPVHPHLASVQDFIRREGGHTDVEQVMKHLGWQGVGETDRLAVVRQLQAAGHIDVSAKKGNQLQHKYERVTLPGAGKLEEPPAPRKLWHPTPPVADKGKLEEPKTAAGVAAVLEKIVEAKPVPMPAAAQVTIPPSKQPLQTPSTLHEVTVSRGIGYSGKSGAKAYLAKITGTDPKYGLEREFQKGQATNYRDFQKAQQRGKGSWTDSHSVGMGVYEKAASGDREHFAVLPSHKNPGQWEQVNLNSEKLAGTIKLAEQSGHSVNELLRAHAEKVRDEHGGEYKGVALRDTAERLHKAASANFSVERGWLAVAAFASDEEIAGAAGFSRDVGRFVPASTGHEGRGRWVGAA